MTPAREYYAKYISDNTVNIKFKHRWVKSQLSKRGVVPFPLEYNKELILEYFGTIDAFIRWGDAKKQFEK
jgi:hypothetical protein